MDALTTWRCSTCGIGNQSCTSCMMCSTPRSTTEGSGAFRILRGNAQQGNVYNIHAPTQFNSQTQEPEPELVPAYAVAAPAPPVDTTKRFLARSLYAIGLAVAVAGLVFAVMTIAFFAFIFYKAYLAGMA